MNVWTAASVEDVPEIVLVRWSVRELPSGGRHFVGFNVTEVQGRVSSRIDEFDADRRTGRTHSGRVYKLDGPQGIDADAEYTWGAWCQMTGEDPSARHVSDEELGLDGDDLNSRPIATRAWTIDLPRIEGPLWHPETDLRERLRAMAADALDEVDQDAMEAEADKVAHMFELRSNGPKGP